MRISEILLEIEIGGQVDSSHLDDMNQNFDFEPKQLSLFPDIPNEPNVPKKMEMMGRIGKYYVVRKNDDGNGNHKDGYTYYLFDSGKLVAYVSTIHPDADFGDAYPGRAAKNPDLNGIGLRVVSVYFDPVARGQGLSVALYEWLLKNVCDYILPDDLQTPGGVYIWKQLVRDPRFEVEIFNCNTYQYHRAKPGVVWSNVYKSYNLFPFVTLAGKAYELTNDGESE